MISLYECFESIKDPRGQQGKRYSMSAFLTMITLAYMSGHYSMKGVERYFKNNEAALTEIFGLEHGVPCFSKIRTFLMELDFEELNDIFMSWSQSYIKSESKEWLAIDGKSLGSTLKDYYSANQSFQSMVGAFMSKSGINIGYAKFDNGKKSEAVEVRELIAKLEENKFMITLDALHCEKKL